MILLYLPALWHRTRACQSRSDTRVNPLQHTCLPLQIQSVPHSLWNTAGMCWARTFWSGHACCHRFGCRIKEI